MPCCQLRMATKEMSIITTTPHKLHMTDGLVLVYVGAMWIWASGQPFLGLPAAGCGT